MLDFKGVCLPHIEVATWRCAFAWRWRDGFGDMERHVSDRELVCVIGEHTQIICHIDNHTSIVLMYDGPRWQMDRGEVIS